MNRKRVLIALAGIVLGVMGGMAGIALSQDGDACGAGERRELLVPTWAGVESTEGAAPTADEYRVSAHDAATFAWRQLQDVDDDRFVEPTASDVASLAEVILATPLTDDGKATIAVDDAMAPTGRSGAILVVGEIPNGTLRLESISWCYKVE